MLPTLVAKSPQIYAQLSSGIHTNLSLQQIAQLAALAVKIPEQNIQNRVMPANCFTSSMYEGQSIEIPDPSCIRRTRDEVFTTANVVGPVSVSGEGTLNDLLELAKAEQARITLQNGTQDGGLAERTAEYLREQGLNIIEVTNADQYYAGSGIIIYSSRPYTAGYLAKLANIPTGSIFNRYDPHSNPEIVFILGQDWAGNNSLP